MSSKTLVDSSIKVFARKTFLGMKEVSNANVESLDRLLPARVRRSLLAFIFLFSERFKMADTKDGIRKEVGKVVEDVGRMLQRKKPLTNDELDDLSSALTRSSNALQRLMKIPG